MLRLLAIIGAVAYPLALVAVILAFRYVGERWWVTLAAMYLPRLGFALPLPFILVAVYFWGPESFRSCRCAPSCFSCSR